MPNGTTTAIQVSQKRDVMLFVALGPVQKEINDGDTPARHSMLLRHTGTQVCCVLLRPSRRVRHDLFSIDQ